jgi:iron complex transport system substrate-binding protein
VTRLRRRRRASAWTRRGAALGLRSRYGTYVSLANHVQEQTKIPYVLLDGAFAKTPEVYRLLGDLLGVKERAEQLAQYADETRNGLAARVVSIPEANRPRM